MEGGGGNSYISPTGIFHFQGIISPIFQEQGINRGNFSAAGCRLSNMSNGEILLDRVVN